MFKRIKFSNCVILIINSLNLLYKILGPNYDYSSPIIGFTFSFLIVRKVYIYHNFKLAYNNEQFKMKINSFWHIAEIFLTVEFYFCTVQFENGILNGLTTEFSNSMIFSVIPCLLMYRFVIYRSLELNY